MQPAPPCPKCGSLVPEGASFCHLCGAPILPSLRPASGRAPWGLADIAKAIGVVVGGTLAISIFSVLVAWLVAGDVDLEDDPVALTVVLAGNLFLELLLLSSAVYFSVSKYGAPWGELGLRLPRRGGFWFTLGLAVGLVIAALALNAAYFITLSAFGIEPDTELPQEYFDNAGPVIVMGLIALGFAPLMEEVFFRGFIFGGLRGRWGVGLGALGSGFIFSLAHIGNPGALYLVPPITAIGALFAFGYAYSGSLLTSMAAHLIFNTISFAISLGGGGG